MAEEQSSQEILNSESSSDNEKLSCKDEKEMGKRTKFTNDALNKTINKIVSSARMKMFAKAYTPVYRAKKEAIEYVHSTFQEILTKHIMSEMDLMFEEENLNGLMNKLDQIIEDSPSSDQAWRPVGVPTEDVRDHLVSVKLRQKKKLEELLLDQERDKRRLMTMTGVKRRLLQEARDKIQKHMQKLEQIVDQEEDNMDQIENFIEEVALKNN